MELTYKNEKLQRLCENPKYNKELAKKYGTEVSKKLPRRIIELKAFHSLSEVPSNLPYRRHKLSGNLNGCFSIRINDQYRLIFKVKQNTMIVDNLNEIKEIEIMEVSKHYE